MRDLPVLDLPHLRRAYRDGLKPSQLFEALLPRLADSPPGVWICRVPDAMLRALA